MKTMTEVGQNPNAATPMELACANFDMLAVAARGAVEKNDAAGLRVVMDLLEKNAAMVKRWLAGAAN